MHGYLPAVPTPSLIPDIAQTRPFSLTSFNSSARRRNNPLHVLLDLRNANRHLLPKNIPKAGKSFTPPLQALIIAQNLLHSFSSVDIGVSGVLDEVDEVYGNVYWQMLRRFLQFDQVPNESLSKTYIRLL